MIKQDFSDIIRIEQASFDDPWEIEDFKKWISASNCPAMVVGQGDKILGYFLFELFSQRISLVKFAVDPQWRRQGIGSQMLEKLMYKVQSHHRKQLTVTVDDDNYPAHSLFRKHGLIAKSVLKDYHENGKDAYYFEREPTEEERALYQQAIKEKRDFRTDEPYSRY